MKFNKVIVEAHRGASGYEHQNTMKAFDKAVELKADAIELDIRKTKDGKIVVVHDPTFHGVSINKMTYEELLNETTENEIPMVQEENYHFDMHFTMPLLEDVLVKYKGKILLDIEIKEEGYEEEIVNLILSHLSVDEFQIRSFSELVIKRVKEINKDISAILLIGAEKPKYGIFSRFGEIFPNAKIRRSNCDAVSPHYRLVILGFVKRMHKRNKVVYVWTVNDAKIMNKMVYKAKVDGLVTNYPDLALDVISNKR